MKSLVYGFTTKITRYHQRLRVLVYACGLDVSSRSLSFLAARLREHRHRINSRWRRLPVGRQVLLVLAHLRNGTTYAQLAAGFGVGTSTVYRYISEAVDLLAALAPTLDEAIRATSRKAYVLLDGTLLPIDRIAADRPRPGRPCPVSRELRLKMAKARSVSTVCRGGSISATAGRGFSGQGGEYF